MNDIEFLRHSLATLAYRANKALRDAPPDFADFRATAGCRTPAEIVAHMADLFDWALSIVNGVQKWRDSPTLPWGAAVARFFDSLTAFDRRLAAPEPLAASPERLFQAPVADALTHTGQLALLRRLAGSPVRGENYFVAHIQAGHVGSDQAASVKEFD
ncbi:MAG TPA: hypothetical protein VG274_07590 [Rhizomicrobium sp.]|nr:hypothetical protein [Rhizomicrobium sp.]